MSIFYFFFNSVNAMHFHSFVSSKKVDFFEKQDFITGGDDNTHRKTLAFKGSQTTEVIL